MKTNGSCRIKPDMTVLEVVSRYRETEAVLKSYDVAAGECICCRALFEPLHGVAERYGLDLNALLLALEKAACFREFKEASLTGD